MGIKKSKKLLLSTRSKHVAIIIVLFSLLLFSLLLFIAKINRPSDPPQATRLEQDSVELVTVEHPEVQSEKYIDGKGEFNISDSGMESRVVLTPGDAEIVWKNNRDGKCTLILESIESSLNESLDIEPSSTKAYKYVHTGSLKFYCKEVPDKIGTIVRIHGASN